MQQTYAAVQRDLLEANHLSPDLLDGIALSSHREALRRLLENS